MPAREQLAGKRETAFMYIRFIVLARRSRRPFGLFQSDRWCLEDPELPHWLRDQIEAHDTWFKKNLRVPRAGGGSRIDVCALCWFRPEAHEHIARARELAWLLSEAGNPTAMIKSRRPGQIVYCDEFQIVARPYADTRLRA